MADVKVSGLPSDTSLDGNHYTILNDPTGPTTKRTLLSTLAAFFFNQTNIPDGSGSPRTRMTDSFYDHVASGCVWSGDAYASTRLASMTSGFVYINGRRLTISAVVSRTFTASKDTYVDILDNGDGTATIVYTEVANNAASPALASNSIRIAIIITGASNIASAGSVNQGQETMLLPIVSTVPYQVTDSLGNLICSRDPNRRILGRRETVSSGSTASTTWAAYAALSCPVKIPTGRKVKVTAHSYATNNNTAAYNFFGIFEGTVGDAQRIQSTAERMDTAGSSQHLQEISDTYTPSTLTPVYNVGLKVGGGTGSWSAATRRAGAEGGPAYIQVELV